jgi:L-threo-3-deoxy-hexylosonate aldolase
MLSTVAWVDPPSYARCGNVGKLTRICATISTPSFASEFPRKFTTANVPFLVLGGLTDTIIPTLVVRGHGAITGLANIAPVCFYIHRCLQLWAFYGHFFQYSCAKLFKLATAVVTDPSLLEEANRVQGIVANADYVMGQSGIMGAKGILEKLYGYGGRCRRPLPSITPAALEALWENPHLQALIGLEKSLAAQ